MRTSSERADAMLIEKYLKEKITRSFNSEIIIPGRTKPAGIGASFGIRMYFDIAPIANADKALQKVREVFDPNIFDDGEALSEVLNGAKVEIGRDTVSRDMYFVEVEGELAALRKNIEKNDPEGFGHALEKFKANKLGRYEK